jgi:hypothetical protein
MVLSRREVGLWVYHFSSALLRTPAVLSRDQVREVPHLQGLTITCELKL